MSKHHKLRSQGFAWTQRRGVDGVASLEKRYIDLSARHDALKKRIVP